VVIACAGLLLGRRYVAARMLVPCGISAMAFGWVFGSVFGMEHLLQPLWLHPVDAPQAVLVPPLLCGALLLLVGMGLAGMAAAWERRLVAWARQEGGLVLGYLALLGLLLPPLGGSFAILWLAWLAWWSFTTYRDDGPRRLAGAFFDLLEQAMRLLLNTLSFARVGAFALAHAGLSLATVQLADAVPWTPGSVAVLVFGNLVVLGLEGLVVSIQTTRLLLFEFFLRFLHGDGRPLHPLALPRFS
jgi:V/A-type H+-transporting ATPase subunit I